MIKQIILPIMTRIPNGFFTDDDEIKDRSKKVQSENAAAEATLNELLNAGYKVHSTYPVTFETYHGLHYLLHKPDDES